MCDCTCPRCDVSKTRQVQFGLLLGYKPCCIDYFCHVLPYKFKKFDFSVHEEPFMKWFHKEREKAGLGRLYAMSDFIQMNFEKVGITEVFPCFKCKLAVLKHVYENRDWKSALDLVVDFEARAFGREDPSKDELLQAVETRWGGTDADERIKEDPHQIFEILESVVVVD